MPQPANQSAACHIQRLTPRQLQQLQMNRLEGRLFTRCPVIPPSPCYAHLWAMNGEGAIPVGALALAAAAATAAMEDPDAVAEGAGTARMPLLGTTVAAPLLP